MITNLLIYGQSNLTCDYFMYVEYVYSGYVHTVLAKPNTVTMRRNVLSGGTSFMFW